MNIGGVEKALLGELESYPPENNDVTVAMLEQKGGFLPYLPKHIKVIELPFYAENKHIFNNPPLQNIKKAFRIGKYFLSFKLLYAYICLKLTGTQKTLYNLIFKHVPKLQENYDKAFAYAGPFPFIDYFVTQKVSAKEKEVWIHYDVSKINPDTGIINQLYHEYNNINIVSTQGKYIFDKKFSRFANNTRFYPNKISQTKIFEFATNKENPYNNNCINIVTVGRVSKEKGQFMTLKVVRQLLNNGYNVTWHYIGDGNDINNCKQEAKRLNITNNVLFYGAIPNPYPYMKYCDIYVQPSIHEGFCITLAEAKIFNIPIIATNFTGAKEQLKGYNYPNIIVDFSSSSIFNGIKCIIGGK